MGIPIVGIKIHVDVDVEFSCGSQVWPPFHVPQKSKIGTAQRRAKRTKQHTSLFSKFGALSW